MTTMTNGHRAASLAGLNLPVSAPTTGPGGRLTSDFPDVAGYIPAMILLPPDAEGQWRALDLDLKSLDRIPATRLLELLADISPLMSRAVWDLQRFCNPGWSYDIVAADGKTVVLAPGASAAVDAFFQRLKDLYGSPNVVINALFMNALLRGAFFCELVLDRAGRVALDLAVPDAATARFRRIPDPERGQIYQLGQLQGGNFVALDRPTIRYAVVDRFPGSPYGRAPLAPMIFTCLFDIGMKRDTARVVGQQGWPRHDIVLDTLMILERLERQAAATGEGVDLAAYNAELARMVAAIQDGYARVPPDGAWVHGSDTVLNAPKGAVDTRSLGAIEGLTRINERAGVQSGKGFGYQLSLDQGGTQDTAIRQIESYLQTIRTFQHAAEDILGGLLTLVLHAQGLPGMVRFTFTENRSSEEIRDLQALQLRLSTARTAYDNGLIDQDGQARMALGLDKADQPEPRVQQVPAQASDGLPPNTSLDGQPNRSIRALGTGEEAAG